MRQTLGSFTVVFLLPAALIISCQQSYQLTLGKTYFSEAMRLNRSEVLSPKADTLVMQTIQGVYGAERVGDRDLPVLRQFDPAKGKQLIWLADSLPVVKRSWVRIKGTLSTKQISLSPKFEPIKLSALNVEICDNLADLNPLVPKAEQEYSAIRNRLQASITPARSKLQLPEHPHWQLAVDPESNRAIVSMNVNDLMYEAEIDFVYDIAAEKLLSVYAVESFKGE
jgi:hypothetical protein